MSFAYHLWGNPILSDFDLGELEPAHEEPCANGAIRIVGSARESWPSPENRVLLEDRFDSGDIWLSSQKAKGGYILSFPGLCSFRIESHARRIDCALESDIPTSVVAHMILDHALPRLLSLLPGFVVFHASGIQVGNEVFAVLGQSGQGKSTLASWFGQQGYPLLTDDCLVVRWDEGAGQWLAQPSYHSVRLWPDSVEALGIPQENLREFAGYSAKRRTGREVDFRFASSGLPLAACFVLGNEPAHAGSPKLHPLSVNEAFRALAGAVFRIDPENSAVNRREFDVLTRLIGTVRFWSLHYEREYRWLPSVQQTILNAIETQKEPAA